MMLMPWWFVLSFLLIVVILSFTVGYAMATGRYWWADPDLKAFARSRVRKWTRRHGH